MSSSASSTTPEPPVAVVVDTMIASAWLSRRPSARKERWAPLLTRSAWVLPFTVVAEMRFGADVARWGQRRLDILERLIARSAVIPPINEVTDSYVELRTWCVRNGHGLGAKDHEADRWVAAQPVHAFASPAARGHVDEFDAAVRADHSVRELTLIEQLDQGEGG